MFVVYFPLAHMVWGATGMMNGVWNADATIKAIDFAGGTVVHMSSGWSALILCLILGKRAASARSLCLRTVWCSAWLAPACCGSAGTGSMPAARWRPTASPRMRFITTTLATATASFVWAMARVDHQGQAELLGFCSGAVAGLVVITPACGFVNATGAMVIGFLAGLIPFLAVT